MELERLQLDLFDLHTIVNLSKEILGQDNFERMGYREWKTWMKRGMLVFSLKTDNQCIGLGTVSFYDKQNRITKPCFGQMATLDNGQIHPLHRGHYYQKNLIEYRIEYILSLGIEEIYTKVHKNNIASIKNIEASGFIYDGMYERGVRAYQYKIQS